VESCGKREEAEQVRQDLRRPDRLIVALEGLEEFVEGERNNLCGAGFKLAGADDACRSQTGGDAEPAGAGADGGAGSGPRGAPQRGRM